MRITDWTNLSHSLTHARIRSHQIRKKHSKKLEKSNRKSIGFRFSTLVFSLSGILLPLGIESRWRNIKKKKEKHFKLGYEVKITFIDSNLKICKTQKQPTWIDVQKWRFFHRNLNWIRCDWVKWIRLIYCRFGNAFFYSCYSKLLEFMWLWWRLWN